LGAASHGFAAPAFLNNQIKLPKERRMKPRTYITLLIIASLPAFVGCKSTPQMSQRPDFLSTYTHLQKVDDTTYRYVSQPLLANCNKFIVSPVKVLFNDFQGNPITTEQRQRSADFVRQTISQALSARYPVVTEPGPEVGEIRIAITEGYRSGGKLGLCVQGEILDNSNTQVAAVLRTEINDTYSPGWEDKLQARKMVEEWAQRLVAAIDKAHGR